MEISKINLLKDNFNKAIDRNYNFDSLFFKDAVDHFAKNWSTSGDDLSEMWVRSLHSDISRHHWQHQNYEPKNWIKRFFELDGDYTKSMFNDLFDEDLSLSGRVERFQFYSEELLKMYRDKNKMSIETSHHQDHQAVLLYLSLRYPRKYTLYNFEYFQYFVSFVKAKTALTIHDMDRFKKLTNLVYNIVSKDEIFMAKFKKFYSLDEEPKNKFAVVFEILKFGFESK